MSESDSGGEPPHMRLGELSRVPARSAWLHEAHDFTPWLAENIELLGDALDLKLTLEKAEHAIGRYSLDLLLSDSRERVVVVENQFGQTDHDHLGKLLTYCAGTEAAVVIWIAETLNAEHVAALEWLNEQTVQGVGFFGVELELLTIDGSAPAPNFRVVVKPNEWVKEVRPARETAIDWDWEAYVEHLNVLPGRVAVGRMLVTGLESEIARRELPWEPRFRKGFISFQRPGGYNVLLVDLYWKKAPRLGIKLPDEPSALGLDTDLGLAEVWDAAERVFGWTVPSVGDVRTSARCSTWCSRFSPCVAR